MNNENTFAKKVRSSVLSFFRHVYKLKKVMENTLLLKDILSEIYIDWNY